MLLPCRLCAKWSPRYLTCLVCVICVPFNWIFGGFRFLNVNVIWLHLLGFAFICLSCNHFSIFMMCSCSNVSFFLFNSLHSQFVQFGHLEEFFNRLVIMSVTTPSGVPSSRLLGYTFVT